MAATHNHGISDNKRQTEEDVSDHFRSPRGVGEISVGVQSVFEVDESFEGADDGHNPELGALNDRYDGRDSTIIARTPVTAMKSAQAEMKTVDFPNAPLTCLKKRYIEVAKRTK
jgi:hypothetical protein